MTGYADVHFPRRGGGSPVKNLADDLVAQARGLVPGEGGFTAHRARVHTGRAATHERAMALSQQAGLDYADAAILVEHDGWNLAASHPTTFMLAAQSAPAQDGEVGVLVAGLVRSRGLTVEQARMKAIEMLAEQQIVERVSELQRQQGLGAVEATEQARRELQGRPPVAATAPRFS